MQPLVARILLNHMRPHISPIMQQAASLDPAQRRFLSKVAFWLLFVYLEMYVLELAAPELLIDVGVAFVLAFVFKATELGRRPNLFALNAGIFASLAIACVRQMSMVVVLDFTVLGLLTALEIRNRKQVFLWLLTGDHLASIFFNPWCLATAMKTSPPIAAHVIARVFGALLAIVLVLRQRHRWLEPERLAKNTSTTAPPRQRPLTVAEWEARNSRN